MTTGIDSSSDPLPAPRTTSRWRWAPRTALVGGSVVAVALALGTGAAGAATSTGTPAHGATGRPPAGAAGHSPLGNVKPTVVGTVTAVGNDRVTLRTMGPPNSSNASATHQTVVVTYDAATTRHTLRGTSSSSALTVGEFVVVVGTRQHDGTVAATALYAGAAPRGPGGSGTGRPPSGTGPGGAPPQG